ncbi:carbohydrate porin [Halomonas nitroreducens]|nr:carbohydrate porin [Halomonas nitroreducens]
MTSIKRHLPFSLAPLSIALSLASPVMAGMTYEGDNGSLSFAGDVELDINAYNSQEAARGSIFFAEEIETRDEYNQTGRVLFEIAGERRSTEGHYARFKAQPLLGSDGGVGVDDAWLAIGNGQGGEVKVGRFEGYDLFPLQDVFIEHNGDTANNLYRDGSGYIYQVKEGRGRGASAGQVLISQQVGDLYAELGTLFGDRSNLFDSDTYHGFSIDRDDTKNSAILRPVLAWTPGPWTLAAGAETNVVSDAVVDERGVDISDRTGYGIRLSYAAGDLSVNLNLAYLDAHEESNATVGVNALWRRVGLGYIHADNEIGEVNPAADPEAVTPEGNYTADTIYTSYHFPDVLGIEDFHTYLGAFYSMIDHDANGDLSDADRYGARLRLKYHF